MNRQNSSRKFFQIHNDGWRKKLRKLTQVEKRVKNRYFQKTTTCFGVHLKNSEQF